MLLLITRKENNLPFNHIDKTITIVLFTSPDLIELVKRHKHIWVHLDSYELKNFILEIKRNGLDYKKIYFKATDHISSNLSEALIDLGYKGEIVYE